LRASNIPATQTVQRRGNKIAASAVLTAVSYKEGRMESARLAEPDKFSRFEQAILPYLDAACNLARWLMRNDDEAADAV
jgi:hypothetical protein